MDPDPKHPQKLPPISELQDTTLAEVRFTIKALLSAVEQYLGVSLARYRLYEHLVAVKELSQADLQRKLGVDGAVVTRLVKQMENEGLVTRRSSPSDNRFTLVSLTPKAHRSIEEMLARRLVAESAVMEGISREDVDCMKRTLARMRQNAQNLSASADAKARG